MRVAKKIILLHFFFYYVNEQSSHFLPSTKKIYEHEMKEKKNAESPGFQQFVS